MARSIPKPALVIAVALGVQLAGVLSGRGPSPAWQAQAQLARALSPPVPPLVAQLHAPDPLDDFPPQPDLVLVLTGEQLGHLEPCGCTEHQSGGISRRATFIRQLRDDRGWPVVALELGGLVNRSGEQASIKFETTLQALAAMRYDAIALGPHDLQAKSPFDLWLANQTYPLVLANLAIVEPGVPAPYRIIERNGRRVGVTAVFGQGYAPEVQAEEYTLTPPAEALEAILPQLQEQADLLVLLAHAPSDESRALAAQFPQFDVVMSAGGPSEPGPEEWIGDTLFVRVGTGGKDVGVVAWYRSPSQGGAGGSSHTSAPPYERGAGGRPRRLRYTTVRLEQDRFSEAPEVVELLQFYLGMVADLRLAETPELLPRARHPRGAQFVGSQRCGECHTYAYGIWSASRHSHAFETLTHAEAFEPFEDGMSPRQFDPECLACHTTGWQPQDVIPWESGFVSFEDTPLLAANGCENCHGPGSLHVAAERGNLPDRIQRRREMLEVAPGTPLTADWARQNLCIRCHDAENSPNFEFDRYWREVVHTRGANPSALAENEADASGRSTWMWYAGGAAALVLLGAAAWLARRRKAA